MGIAADAGVDAEAGVTCGGTRAGTGGEAGTVALRLLVPAREAMLEVFFLGLGGAGLPKQELAGELL